MEMDEQNSDGQQPGIWESWTAASANPSSEQEAGQTEQAANSGDSGHAGQFSTPDATSQLPAFTQPIGYPQAGYPAPGYGQPGYGQPGYGQPGYGQAGYPQQGQPGHTAPGQPGHTAPGQPGHAAPGQPGHTAPGQPGYAAYGYPPGGGFGQPPGGYGGSGYGGSGYGGGGYGGGGYGGPGGYGQPPRRPRGRALTTAITYLAVAAIAATAGGLVVAFADGNQPPSASSGNSGSGNLGAPNGGFFPGAGTGNSNGNNTNSGVVSRSTMQRLSNAVTPGLVVITSDLKYDGDGAAAAATGMIISHNGLVLTNNHVINGTTGLMATVVSTNQQYKATWLGYDKSSDVAVIKLDGASNLPTVPIGDSSTVKVGNDVVGMGNANGTGHISYVAGTITSLDQTITASDNGSGVAPERLTGMLQTNAQIIPGDSGGPLVSTDGKVIGMDTAASTNSIANSGQNAGFAIPINRAIRLAREIIAGQPAPGLRIGSAGFVGVLVPSGLNGTQSTKTSPSAQLRQEEAQQPSFGPSNPAPNGCVQSDANAGVPTRIAPVTSGTLVLGALCQTPAAGAGIGAGDVITRVNSHAISSPASLMNILQGIHGGASVKLTWVTPDDQSVTRTLTLSAAPPQ
jgi:S1-C subfamily serine protease